MANASQIKEHMEVKGSDGKHVGTVLGVEDGSGWPPAAWIMKLLWTWSTSSKTRWSGCARLPGRHADLALAERATSSAMPAIGSRALAARLCWAVDEGCLRQDFYGRRYKLGLNGRPPPLRWWRQEDAE